MFVFFFFHYSEDSDVHIIGNLRPVVIPSLSCLVWEDKRWPVVVNLPLEFEKCISSVSLPHPHPPKKKKPGEVDRGRRPRGPLSEPGADEEQPVGGEREVHPPLEENQPTTCHDFARPTRKHARTHTQTHTYTLTHTHIYIYIPSRINPDPLGPRSHQPHPNSKLIPTN